MLYNPKLRRLLQKLTKKPFGEYRLLPFFFIAGAVLEYSMIHWQVGEVSFYKTYKRRKVEDLVEARLNRKQLLHQLSALHDAV